ncbi:sensory box protein [Methyloversatilis sp. RAC08]|uniref:chemotaxis protein CheB n=1 Tax=Methyloversatilis sp. RAC08 TaxID=1842540 RepID=UPI00083D6904|nr:chemotaxis protein CheB [Methyloversatilis sp. RAC08]AOF80820.1 sensory box protein [Methyloversatilis sp. RAC08]
MTEKKNSSTPRRHSGKAAQPVPEASADIAASLPRTIVALGGSAGGLDAYEAFFRSMPAARGLAFVLVAHLDPSHASMLTEILQRYTGLRVVEAQDGMVVMADTLYVAPPNRDMTIANGTLLLSLPDAPRGQRMPIDAFFRSLAEDQGERAVGIILSGTGTDGTQGLRAILGAGGITLAQEPASARYEGMPLSAIQSGYAMHVLPVEKMPPLLLANLPKLPEPAQVRAEATQPLAEPVRKGGIDRLLSLLRTATGHDFSLYKKSTIGRRIERRMAQHDLDDIELYARYMKEHPEETQALFKELLINVTSFFRDPGAFDVLKQDILPLLFAGKPEDYVIRIWVAGCSTGEEVYSIAMVLREFMDDTHQELKVQLYGTDLDDDAIALARAGLYPPNITPDITPERLRRFFSKEEIGFRVKKAIREMVVFAAQNAIKDPPFTRLDMLSCRNLMIYLEPELQNRLISTFHYALKPGGVLFLSPSESTGNHPELFSAINRKWKFYRAVHSVLPMRLMLSDHPAAAAESGSKEAGATTKVVKAANFSDFTRRVLLQSYAPASVVTDLKGNILFVHGETGRYLRPAPGQASLNVVDMAREGLQVELRAALNAAVAQGQAMLGREASIGPDGSDAPKVKLSVRPLPGPESGQNLLLVSFEDVNEPAPQKRRRKLQKEGSPEMQRIGELERDLAYTRENLQATIEEQQASNEELKSANEELQSTNEELQSTNEELETSKEELQSVNEELISVNTELQAKIEQLASMQDDMKNVLDNINVGTVFLDQHLAIRRYTREAARIYRLVATDVGRSLGDIKSDLTEELGGAAQSVLDTLVPFEREVRTLAGASYLARIQPYRTLDNVIEGVVLTFNDISRRIEAEAAEHKARQLAESIVDTVREPLVVLDADMRVVSASRSFYRYFDTDPDDTVGRSLYELGMERSKGRSKDRGKGQWNVPALRELLENLLPRDESMNDFAMEFETSAGVRCRMTLNARRIVGESGQKPLILLAMETGPLTIPSADD